MQKIRTVKRFVAVLLIILLFPINSLSTPVQAYEDSRTDSFDHVHINKLSKYLYLGDNKADNYDFNLEGMGQENIEEYSWYVVPDKGTSNSIVIDQVTGEVTAKNAGTAYICCEIKCKDGTIIRPEAMVIVINDITEVQISNPSEQDIITAGRPEDFNQIIINTSNGKGTKTEGITRWQIDEDTSGVGSADSSGIVYPTKEGSFKIRAICFQDEMSYKRWLRNQKEDLVTAASEWKTVQIVASEGKAIANTQGQLEKALATEEFKEISIISNNPDTFTIKEKEYSDKILVVDAPNADVHNYGKFQNIEIKAVKESTWVEYADGNIVHLLDDQRSFVIEEGSVVKQIVIDKVDSAIHLDIRGKVEQISLQQPANLSLSGSTQEIPLTITENAGKSIVTSSVPLFVTMQANAKLILNQGSEASRIDKSEQSVEANVENHTLLPVSITTNQKALFIVNAGTNGKSDQSTIPASSDRYGMVSITGLSIKPEHMIISVTGSAINVLCVDIEPNNANEINLTWRSADESIAIVDQNGVVTPVAEGTTPVFVEANDIYAMSYVTVVSGSAIAVSGSAIQGGLLQSAGSTIAKELGKGAASYLGGQLMGWGLKKAGIGFEDETQEAINKMIDKLDNIVQQLQNLEVQLESAIKRIENAIDRSEFNTRVGQMSGLIGNINSIRNELNTYLKNADEIQPELLSVYRDNILSNIKSKLISNEYFIHNQLVGIGGQESLIKLYSRYIKNNKRFLTSKDSDAVNAVYEYYKAVQENMLELMVEYYHTYLGNDLNDLINVNRILTTYDENITAQENLLLATIPKDVVIDTAKNIMIYTGDYWRLIFEYNPFRIYRKIYDRPCYYSDINTGIQAYKYMSYVWSYINWRLLTKNEFESWVSESHGDLHGLLANSIQMPLDPNEYIMIIDQIPVFDPFSGWSYKNDYRAYQVSDGKYQIFYSSSDVGMMFGDPYKYKYYYYIVCRTMDTGELNNFFWH